MTTRRLLVAVFAALVVLVAAAGCSSGDSSGATNATKPTETTEAAGVAKIVTFEVPATAECGGATSVTVPVTYSTEGGTAQKLFIDGREVPLAAPSATVDAEVHCDQLPHTFVLRVLDSAKKPTTLQKLLTTNL